MLHASDVPLADNQTGRARNCTFEGAGGMHAKNEGGGGDQLKAQTKMGLMRAVKKWAPGQASLQSCQVSGFHLNHQSQPYSVESVAQSFHAYRATY